MFGSKCNRGLGLVFLGATLALSACSTSTQVIKQASSAELRATRSFELVPTSYADLKVGRKDESEYLARKTPDQRRAWEGDKRAVHQAFATSLAESAGDKGIRVTNGSSDAPFLIRPSIGFIEPGFLAGLGGHPSEVVMKVEIVTRDGRVIDELRVEHTTFPSVANATTRDRLEHDADILGETVAEYLAERSDAP